MEITLNLALARRLAEHLLDVLSSDEAYTVPGLRVEMAEEDLHELVAAILAATESPFDE